MFTGIIEERGTVTAVAPSGDGVRLTVQGPLVVSDAHQGDSIAVSGVCLTVVDQGEDWFTADVMRQSLDMSTLGALTPGYPVNLERAVATHTRLGGHIVQGHIDGTGEVLHFRDFVSGATLRNIVDRATKNAVKDQLATGQVGVGAEHLAAAIRSEFVENEDLPSGAHPEDWARISGRRGRRVDAVIPLQGRPEQEVVEA